VNVDGTYINNKSPAGRGGVFAVNRLYSGGRMNVKGTYINNEAGNTGGTFILASRVSVAVRVLLVTQSTIDSRSHPTLGTSQMFIV
jgi:hypothetical protein